MDAAPARCRPAGAVLAWRVRRGGRCLRVRRLDKCHRRCGAGRRLPGRPVSSGTAGVAGTARVLSSHRASRVATLAAPPTTEARSGPALESAPPASATRLTDRAPAPWRTPPAFAAPARRLRRRRLGGHRRRLRAGRLRRRRRRWLPGQAGEDRPVPMSPARLTGPQARGPEPQAMSRRAQPTPRTTAAPAVGCWPGRGSGRRRRRTRRPGGGTAPDGLAGFTGPDGLAGPGAGAVDCAGRSGAS